MRKLPVTGPELRALREKRDITQRQLGELLGQHEKTITRLEGMREIPRVNAIAAVVFLAPGDVEEMRASIERQVAAELEQRAAAKLRASVAPRADAIRATSERRIAKMQKETERRIADLKKEAEAAIQSTKRQPRRRR